jgi:hypothetical protein
MKKFQLKPKSSNSNKKLEIAHDEYICNLLLKKKKSEEIKDITNEILNCVNETKIKLEKLNFNFRTLEGSRSERRNNTNKLDDNKINISEYDTIRSRNRSPGLEQARSQKYLKQPSKIQMDMDLIKKKLHEIKLPKYNTIKSENRDLVK